VGECGSGNRRVRRLRDVQERFSGIGSGDQSWEEGRSNGMYKEGGYVENDVGRQSWQDCLSQNGKRGWGEGVYEVGGLF